MSRREGGLFGFSEVVINSSVENKLSDRDQRIVCMRNDLGNIEDVPFVVECILFRDSLDRKLPFGSLSSVKVVDQISGSIVRIIEQIGSLLGSEVFDSGKGFEVKLDPESLAFLVNPTESMRTVTVHVSVTIGSSTVAHQDSHLVGAFGRKSPEVPSGSSVFQVGAGILLLGVDEVRELNGVSNKEDWGVVSGHVPVALFSVELNSKT